MHALPIRGSGNENEQAPATEFWTVPTIVNVLAPIYPINLMHGAESAEDTLFAALALIGVVFLLITVDAVGLAVAGEFDTAKR
jgi:hypothetical protein